MRLEKKSPCKVNLLLNILGKRADGFHELETVMQPVNLCDEMTFERAGVRRATDVQPSGVAGGFKKSRPPRRDRISRRRENFRRRPHPSAKKPAAGRRHRRRQRQRRRDVHRAERTVWLAAAAGKTARTCRRARLGRSIFSLRPARRSPPAAAKKCSRLKIFPRCAARRFSSPIPASAFPRRGRIKTSRGFPKR